MTRSLGALAFVLALASLAACDARAPSPGAPPGARALALDISPPAPADPPAETLAVGARDTLIAAELRGAGAARAPRWSLTDTAVLALDSASAARAGAVLLHARAAGQACAEAAAGAARSRVCVVVRRPPAPDSSRPMTVRLVVRDTVLHLGDTLTVRGTCYGPTGLPSTAPLWLTTSNTRIVTFPPDGGTTRAPGRARSVGVGRVAVRAACWPVAGASGAERTIALTVRDTAAPAPPPVVAPPPAPAPSLVLDGDSAWDSTLYRGTRDSVPHFPHATFALTDFRCSYYPCDYALLGQRYDFVMSGSQAKWRAADPGVRWARYQLLWSVLQDGQRNTEYQDAQTWLVAHGYESERAFLHVAGAPAADSAHRLVVRLWDTPRFAWNPADRGAVAWAMAKLAADRAAGANGIFYDEFGRGPQTLGALFRPDTVPAELTRAQYEAALVAELRALRAAAGPVELMVNTASYETPFDSTTIVAAGAGQLERTLFIESGNVPIVWAWVGRMLAAGTTRLELDDVHAWGDPLPATLTAGNYSAPLARQKMSTYLAYQLARPPAAADDRRLAFNQNADLWQLPREAHWLRAFEADLGAPTSGRVVLRSGADPKGNAYKVIRREFAHGAVYFRQVAGWADQTFGDSTAIAVPLTSSGRVLRANGWLGPVVDTVWLRTSEAVFVRTVAEASAP